MWLTHVNVTMMGGFFSMNTHSWQACLVAFFLVLCSRHLNRLLVADAESIVKFSNTLKDNPYPFVKKPKAEKVPPGFDN